MATGEPTEIRAAMERAVGPNIVSDDVAGYSIDGLRPTVVVTPSSVEQLSQLMATASKEGMAVAPWGGGTQIGLGNALRRLDAVVQLSRINRVIHHNPGDLTATVEAGTTFTEFQRALADHGQFLALDPPLPHRATIGGTLATGGSGHLRWQLGNPRDLVIGMKIVQADGTMTKSGGQVVKNVSGYDMTRLHIGALGTLGIISEVSFKLTPLPRNEATIVSAFESSDECLGAGLSIFHSHVMPLALTAFDSRVNDRASATSVPGNHLLAVRLAGRPRTLERQVREYISICRERGAGAVESLDEAESDAAWRRVTDFGSDEQTSPAMTGRASVPPTKVPQVIKAVEKSTHDAALEPAILSQPGYGSIVVNWFSDNDAPAEEALSEAVTQARDAVHQAGGTLVIERCPVQVKAKLDVWDDVGESLAIMRRMKQQYDPKGVLNPGRFAGGI